MVIDAHAHINWSDDPEAPFAGSLDEAQIQAGDALGIDVFVCSCLPPRPATPDTFRKANDRLIAAMRHYPGRIWGYCYVNPGYSPEALAEIERCLAVENMVGVKLYNEYFVDDPVVRPVVELCLERDVPILVHQGHCTDPLPDQPFLSDADNLVRLTRRYPQAKIILAHIGGGGDWEWTIKRAADSDTLLADTSGSVVDEGLVEMAVDLLGPQRLLFGCDGSLSAGVGKLRGAQISQDAQRMILGENFLRLVSGTRLQAPRP